MNIFLHNCNNMQIAAVFTAAKRNALITCFYIQLGDYCCCCDTITCCRYNNTQLTCHTRYTNIYNQAAGRTRNSSSPVLQSPQHQLIANSHYIVHDEASSSGQRQRQRQIQWESRFNVDDALPGSSLTLSIAACSC